MQKLEKNQLEEDEQRIITTTAAHKATLMSLRCNRLQSLSHGPYYAEIPKSQFLIKSTQSHFLPAHS